MSFILGSLVSGPFASAQMGTPFLQEEIDAIIEIIQDLQDQLNDIQVTWVNVTDKPAGFADDIDNDTLIEISTSCLINQIAKWDGNQWICADESPGSFSTEFMLELGPDTVTNVEGPNQFKVLQDFKIINLPSSTQEYTIPINFMRMEANMAVDSSPSVSSDAFRIILEESTRGQFGQIISLFTKDAALDYRTSNNVLHNQDQVVIESGSTEKFFRVIAFTTDRDASVPTGSFDNFQLLINFPLPAGATFETIP